MIARYALLCGTTLLLVIGSAALWDWNVSRNEVFPVSGGASLSIAGPTFSQKTQALMYAGAINAAGHPTYIRSEPEQQKYQVLVGPFVASSEAQAAQKALARRGLSNTRLMVDDSLRDVEQPKVRWSWWQRPDPTRLVAAAAPGILSLALEMPEPPREVLSQRTGTTRLDIEISPVGPDVRARRWTAPRGSVLVNQVEFVPAPDGSDRLYVRLDIPEDAISRVRLEGSRVYVDLAWPDPPWPLPGMAPRVLRARAPKPTEENTTAATDAKVHDAISRFRQVQPFLLSAVDSPEPQVLAAVVRTLDDLSGELPTDTKELPPVRLREAISMARAAASTEFVGDRAVQARRAIELFEAVAAPLSVDTAVRP